MVDINKIIEEYLLEQVSPPGGDPPEDPPGGDDAGDDDLEVGVPHSVISWRAGYYSDDGKGGIKWNPPQVSYDGGTTWIDTDTETGEEIDGDGEGEGEGGGDAIIDPETARLDLLAFLRGEGDYPGQIHDTVGETAGDGTDEGEGEGEGSGTLPDMGRPGFIDNALPIKDKLPDYGLPEITQQGYITTIVDEDGNTIGHTWHTGNWRDPGISYWLGPPKLE